MRGSSSECCIKLGIISRRAASLEHTMCQCVGLLSDTAFGPLISDAEFRNAASDAVKLAFINDDGIKPGGGSTPSSISRARCIRACLSQSSIGHSSALQRVKSSRGGDCSFIDKRITLLPLQSGEFSSNKVVGGNFATLASDSVIDDLSSVTESTFISGWMVVAGDPDDLDAVVGA